MNFQVQAHFTRAITIRENMNILVRVCMNLKNHAYNLETVM